MGSEVTQREVQMLEAAHVGGWGQDSTLSLGWLVRRCRGRPSLLRVQAVPTHTSRRD